MLSRPVIRKPNSSTHDTPSSSNVQNNESDAAFSIDPSNLRTDRILGLQQSVGNQTVQRMLKTGGRGAIIQRELDEEEEKKRYERIRKAYVSNGLTRMLIESETKIITRKQIKSGRMRPTKLGQTGIAMIEFIRDNPDDRDLFVAKGEGEGTEGCDTRQDVVTQAKAFMAVYEAHARVSDGGGLMHPTAEKQWAYHQPSYSASVEQNILRDRQALPYWQSPTDKPAPGDATPSIVHTPGGSDMHLATTYDYMSPGATHHRTHMYAKDIPPRQPEFASTGVVAPTMGRLTRFLQNYKRVNTTVDQKVLDKWAGKRGGWRPDQNTAMSGVSAGQAAQASGYPNSSWQWLHLIAFTFGGPDGVQPNTPDNLVAGTAAANGHHLVLENMVKKLILGGETDAVQIAAVAFMDNTSYHVATRIEYGLTWKNSSNRDQFANFTVPTLDVNKSVGGHLGILYPEVKYQ